MWVLEKKFFEDKRRVLSFSFREVRSDCCMSFCLRKLVVEE